jgi:glycine C-acetyltransferase/8-amino-7-oxononanoate synthase
MKGYDRELSKLRGEGLLRKPVCFDSSRNSRLNINGKTFLNFSSNDYLNLSGHPAIIRAAVSALRKFGVGSGASRLLSGTLSSHERLEARVASFKRTRASILFNTGYSANTGVIPALSGDASIIFSDELNHASIIDGIRLSGADVKIYRHRDLDHLHSLLKKSSRSRNRKLIITDTVFSMDGDVAPLKDILSLSERYDADLMVDDAHGIGVLGRTGRGGLEHFRMKSGNIIQMGTLSKSAGCFGAFVAGSKGLINLLTNRARSFIYSTSLPPSVAEAALKAMDIIEFDSQDTRKKLWNNRHRLYNGLNNMGFDTLGSETPIIPLLAGDVQSAMKIGRHLYSKGIYAPAIRPPTVPEANCRIRFSVTAAHTNNDIDMLLDCLGKFKK